MSNEFFFLISFFSQQQEETTRRHATQLEEVRRKAVEMSVHREASAEDHQNPSQTDEKKTTESTDTQRKFCTLCNLMVSHKFR